MTLNLIPAGEFVMGSPDDDEDALADEEAPDTRCGLSPFTWESTR